MSEYRLCVCECVCVNEWHGNRIITVNCYIERNGNGRQNWGKRPNAKQQQWQGRGNSYTRMFIYVCVCVVCYAEERKQNKMRSV